MGVIELTLLIASTALLIAMWTVLVTLAQTRKPMLWQSADEPMPTRGVSPQRHPLR
jgi:hypothetical protein